MSDPLDQLLAESKHSEDGARDAGRKVFEQALERVKAVAKCIPDDKEDLADEKSDWTIKWEGSLVRPSSFITTSLADLSRNGCGTLWLQRASSAPRQQLTSRSCSSSST